MAMLLPYSRSRVRKRVEYGNLAASAAQPTIWSESEPSQNVGSG